MKNLELFKKDSSPTDLKPTNGSISIDMGSDRRKFTRLEEPIEDYSGSNQYTARPPFFRWITFTDMLPHVKRMNNTSEPFGLENIPGPEYKFCVEAKMASLTRHWNTELKTNKPSFHRAIVKTFMNEILKAFVLVLIENLSKIAYSICMGKIVKIITSSDIQENKPIEELIFYALSLSVLVIISIFAKSWSYFVVAPQLTTVRLTISGFMYKKLNSTSLSSLQEIKIGKVLNLIANDMNDIQNLFHFPTMLVTPFMVAVSTYAMWGYFGASCLIGVTSLVAVIACQVLLSNSTSGLREKNKTTADERVKYTHELIEGIRLVKMYTWEKLFHKKILENRENEHKTFIKIGNIDAVGANLSNLCVYLNILLICILYVTVDGVLSPEKVYASMMILMCLSTSLLSSHQALMALVNVRMVVTRAQEVLAVKDIVSIEDGSTESQTNKSNNPIIFKNFTGFWSKNSHVPCLSDINLTCNPGTVTAVIGKIGAGKTSLLLSFLREMPVTHGSLEYSGQIAYVEQDPIIFSGTVRDNILFGKEFDEDLYKQVIENCRLAKDFESFSHGDLTLIGERGVNLSGGQKARVSLARAFYSQSDIYLLDDPFSALDSKVAREIFDLMASGQLLRDKIVILVTHHLNFAKESEHVVLMDEGKIVAQGTFEYLQSLNLSLLNVFKLSNDLKKNMSLEVSKSGSTIEETEKKEGQEIAKTEDKMQAEQSVHVTWRTYKDYWGAATTVKDIILILVLYATSHGLMIYYSRFIGSWAQQQFAFSQHKYVNSFTNSYYILVSIILLAVIAVISYFKIVKMNQVLYASDTVLHTKMLLALIRSKTAFFDVNPVGRILNRFANDLGILDKTVVRRTIDSFDNAISYIAVLITVCIISPAILIPSLLVMYGLYKTKQAFITPLMILKRLELVSKSPIISAVPATLQGLISIRVYNQGGRFMRDFMDMIFQNMKTYVFLEKTIRLFGFILEGSIQLLTLSGIWIFTILIFYYDIEAGLLGLCLMYLLKIGDQGSMLIRQSLYVDIDMQSAQRMIDYGQIKSEAPAEQPGKDAQVEQKFEGNWPSTGEILLNQVFMRYREELGLVLKGLTINIQGGLKVGCIGRTGAGKSSIIQALFRMVEIEQGEDYRDSYIKIDGVDIGSIGLKLLRSRLSIIPQTPVIFGETIKRNLDPFGTLGDKELWNVLEEVGLKDYVYSLPGRLDTDITGSTSVFSTGQKQLICLARAIINKNKIIILDEATANVDVETDDFIQKAIMEKFKDCTVLTIAHRLITIANYDKVVVIDEGRVAEYDAPYALLVKKIGDTQITRTNGLFSEMVRSTGRSMAKKIFEMAREHYFLQHEKIF